MPDKVLGAISGNTKEAIKGQLEELIQKVNCNEAFKNVEIPILQQIKKHKEVMNQKSETDSWEVGTNLSLQQSTLNSGVSGNLASSISNQDEVRISNECPEIYLKVFEIKDVIDEVKDILKKMQIHKLVVLLDDVSEIDGDALKMFVDTIVAPLNNWSEEFIRFKVAFYPSCVHYGNIDPGKIDIINLDFYILLKNRY